VVVASDKEIAQGKENQFWEGIGFGFGSTVWVSLIGAVTVPPKSFQSPPPTTTEVVNILTKTAHFNSTNFKLEMISSII
jgi:hypothetical protein